MPASNPESVVDLSLLAAAEDSAAGPGALERDVLDLFDRCAPSLMRYVASFGLKADETEDIVQDVFLLLFRHLQLGRPRSNLKGWLFQVAHNLALRQRRHMRNRQESTSWDETLLARHADPSPDPETRMAESQRQRRLRSVLEAMPDRDRRCLSLRAEGLRYREIAAALGISLGAVAKSIARSMSRVMSADRW